MRSDDPRNPYRFFVIPTHFPVIHPVWCGKCPGLTRRHPQFFRPWPPDSGISRSNISTEFLTRMAVESLHPMKPGLVVLNPRSSTSSADGVRRSVARQVDCGDFAIHEMVEEEDIRTVVRDALERGVTLVVAAGGDGTVSTVADILAGSSASLAIFPMGTTNILARELNIPVEPVAGDDLPAGRLLDGPHALARIDAMKVDGRHYFTQVGVGIDSLMIRDTDDQSKKRFGRAAYLWTAFARLLGFQPRRFTITVDNRSITVRASQVVVANAGMLGQPPFRWGPDIRPDDGRINVCIVGAKSIWNYAHLCWHIARGRHDQSPHIRYLAATRTVSIAAKHPLPVQGDGEIIGETPIQIDLIPAALRVIVPEATSPA